jgi:hypothetical protein
MQHIQTYHVSAGVTTLLYGSEGKTCLSTTILVSVSNNLISLLAVCAF